MPFLCSTQTPHSRPRVGVGVTYGVRVAGASDSAAAMSSFHIVPRAGGEDRKPNGVPTQMPTLNLAKISFASMGGSAEVLHFTENDLAYDVDSSDEDLDGMEHAVFVFEERRNRREELQKARVITEEVNQQLKRVKLETEKSIRQLRDRRERFENAVAVTPTKSDRGVIHGVTGPGDSISEALQLEELQKRRERVDARIDALLGEDFVDSLHMSTSANASANAIDIAQGTLAAAQIEAEYVTPKWKQRRDQRRLEESGRVPREMLQESVVTHRGCNEDLNSETFNSVELVFSKAVASIRTNDLNTLRDLLSAKVLSSAYLDTRDASSSTLLTLACQQGHTKAAKYLLRAGANLNANDDFGRTPIDAAVNEGHFDTADVLVKWAEKHGVQIGEQ